MKTKQNIKFFNILELLIVIAIIGILLSLLFPALKSARSTARQTECMNNQSQIGKAIFIFTVDNEKKVPYAYAPYPSGNPALPSPFGWDDQLRTYLGGSEMSYNDQISRAWTAEESLDILQCPSAKETTVNGHDDRLRNNYVMPAYENGHMARGARPSRFSTYAVDDREPYHRKITALSNPGGTLALTELDYTGPDWTAWQGSGNMVFTAELQAGANGNGFFNFLTTTINTTLELHNREKVNLLLADGHVESHHPFSPDVIGDGDPANPEGMWIAK